MRARGTFTVSRHRFTEITLPPMVSCLINLPAIELFIRGSPKTKEPHTRITFRITCVALSRKRKEPEHVIKQLFLIGYLHITNALRLYMPLNILDSILYGAYPQNTTKSRAQLNYFPETKSSPFLMFFLSSGITLKSGRSALEMRGLPRCKNL